MNKQSLRSTDRQPREKYQDFWKILNKKQLLKTPFIDVYEERLVNKEGKEATYYTVNRRSFAAIVPFWDEDKSTLLVGEWRHGTKDFHWGFPMGFLDQGEKPADTAQRELKEETGYNAERLIPLSETVVSPSYNGSKQYNFIAFNPNLITEETDGEISEFKRVGFDEVASLIVSGEVTDNNTIAAYFLAKEYLSSSRHRESVPKGAHL